MIPGNRYHFFGLTLHPKSAESNQQMKVGDQMAWIYLLIAGVTEVVWAIGLKLADGFTNLVPSIVTLIFIVISFLLFAIAMKTIPIGTAYAVFTGIGAAGTAVLGIWLFNENASVEKLFFLSLLLFGIIGLKVMDGKTASGNGVQP